MTTHPCRVEIRTHSLEDNFKFLLSLTAPHAELMAVVKDEEGVAARTLCPEGGILVLGGAFPGQGAAVAENRLSVVAWQPWQLDELETAARAAGVPAGSLPIHLEIDTGMSRQGVAAEEFRPECGSAREFLARFHPGSPLRLEGVMTHLYAADEADGRVTAAQMVLMEEALGKIRAAGQAPEWLHVGNSATLLTGQTARIAALAARYGMKAMLRPGLALYGVVPRFNPEFELPEPATLAAARARLQPVLTWKRSEERR